MSRAARIINELLDEPPVTGGGEEFNARDWFENPSQPKKPWGYVLRSRTKHKVGDKEYPSPYPWFAKGYSDRYGCCGNFRRNIGDATIFKRLDTTKQWPEMEPVPIYGNPRHYGEKVLNWDDLIRYRQKLGIQRDNDIATDERRRRTPPPKAWGEPAPDMAPSAMPFGMFTTESDEFDPREYMMASSGPDDVLRRELPSFGFKLVKQRTEQDPEEIWQAVISGITHTVSQQGLGYGWTYNMDTVPDYNMSGGPENILKSLERSMPKAKGLRLLPGRGRRLQQVAYGPYYAAESEEPFNARKWFMQDQIRRRAVDLSDEIWKDDKKLRNAFSWLTRIGAAPKFGSLPIHYYQQDQVKAIDAIKAAAREKGIDLRWVRYAAGRILAFHAGKWVPIAALTVGHILPV